MTPQWQVYYLRWLKALNPDTRVQAVIQGPGLIPVTRQGSVVIRCLRARGREFSCGPTLISDIKQWST